MSYWHVVGVLVVKAKAKTNDLCALAINARGLGVKGDDGLWRDA